MVERPEVGGDRPRRRADTGVYCQTGGYGNEKSLDTVGKTKGYSVGFDGVWLSWLSGINGQEGSDRLNS